MQSLNDFTRKTANLQPTYETFYMNISIEYSILLFYIILEIRVSWGAQNSQQNMEIYFLS